MITVLHNQSLFDIAIQEDGTVLSIIDWAVANDISITALLEPGVTLINPNSQFKDTDIAEYFKTNKQTVATAYHE
jgi:hypothetical protein